MLQIIVSARAGVCGAPGSRQDLLVAMQVYHRQQLASPAWVGFRISDSGKILGAHFRLWALGTLGRSFGL